MGWPLGGSLVFGLALSVASTVVLLKALQERRLIESERGKIAVGWLIVEDLAMVLALVLIPAAASISGDGHGTAEPLSAGLNRLLGLDLGITGIIGMTLLKVAAFVGLMLVVGRRIIPWILHRIAHTGSRELFRLGVLAIALGVAFGAAKLFGVSLALGAFFAGMILVGKRAQPSGRTGKPAAPRCFRRAVLRLGRHAVRSEHPDRQSAAAAGDRVHHRHRQIGRRLLHRARLPQADEHRAHDLRQPGADR